MGFNNIVSFHDGHVKGVQFLKNNMTRYEF